MSPCSPCRRVLTTSSGCSVITEASPATQPERACVLHQHTSHCMGWCRTQHKKCTDICKNAVLLTAARSRQPGGHHWWRTNARVAGPCKWVIFALQALLKARVVLSSAVLGPLGTRAGCCQHCPRWWSCLFTASSHANPDYLTKPRHPGNAGTESGQSMSATTPKTTHVEIGLYCRTLSQSTSSAPIPFTGKQHSETRSGA